MKNNKIKQLLLELDHSNHMPEWADQEQSINKNMRVVWLIRLAKQRSYRALAIHFAIFIAISLLYATYSGLDLGFSKHMPPEHRGFFRWMAYDLEETYNSIRSGGATSIFLAIIFGYFSYVIRAIQIKNLALLPAEPETSAISEFIDFGSGVKIPPVVVYTILASLLGYWIGCWAIEKNQIFNGWWIFIAGFIAGFAYDSSCEKLIDAINVTRTGTILRHVRGPLGHITQPWYT